MKFTFYERASYLYDLFTFPKLLYVRDEDMKDLNAVLDDEDTYKYLDYEAYQKFVNTAQKDLEPYKDPILGFYADEAISNYDFPVLLFSSYSFIGYEHFNDYLNDILSNPEATIQKKLLYALYTIENSDALLDDETIYQQIDHLLSNREALLAFIRTIPTTENYRWILTLLIENPKEYIRVYGKLLKDIKPIFDRYAKAYAPKIEAFKNDIIVPLQKDQEKAFNKLTREVVPVDVLEADNRILTSFVNPYRFSIMQFGSDRCILWTLEMQTGFKRIAEFEQDTPKNRAKVFKTLSDETRYQVLKHIAKGNTSTKDIATALNVSSATVIYHINAFLTAKILKVVRSKQAQYEIDYDRLHTFWNTFIEDLKS